LPGQAEHDRHICVDLADARAIWRVSSLRGLKWPKPVVPTKPSMSRRIAWISLASWPLVGPNRPEGRIERRRLMIRAGGLIFHSDHLERIEQSPISSAIFSRTRPRLAMPTRNLSATSSPAASSSAEVMRSPETRRRLDWAISLRAPLSERVAPREAPMEPIKRTSQPLVERLKSAP